MQIDIEDHISFQQGDNLLRIYKDKTEWKEEGVTIQACHALEPCPCRCNNGKPSRGCMSLSNKWISVHLGPDLIAVFLYPEWDGVLFFELVDPKRMIQIKHALAQLLD